MEKISKKNLLYIVFSAVFILIAIGVVAWIVKQEKSNELHESNIETVAGNKGADISEFSLKEKNVVVENKEQAKKALSDMDSAMNSMQSDELEN